MDKTKILILAANPSDTAKLQLENELLKLELLRQKAKLKETFELNFALAVQDEDLQRTLLDFQPDIVHFCGHGNVDGLFLCNKENKKQFVHAEAISNLFKLFADKIRCVVLNACYTEEQAEMIREHIDYVVGMKTAIGDEAALKFSTGFYNAVFAGEDFSKAYELGCNAIDLANIPEYATPVLKQKPKVFVPSFKHDIFISFADADKEWALSLAEYLRKQLIQKLNKRDGFQFYTDNDFSQLSQSAILLVITSPAYYRQYESQLEQLAKQIKQQSFLFWIDYEAIKSPECLKSALSIPYRFYNPANYDTLKDEEYRAKAEDLALIIAKKLQYLKNKYKSQTRIEQEIKSSNKSLIEGYVFLHSALEDFALIDEIVTPLLDEKNIKYALPLQKTYKTASPGEIRDDIEAHIELCHAVLILHEQSASIWARRQLGVCANALSNRKEPLKIIALYKKPENPDPGFPTLKQLRIYDCSSSEIPNYLHEFIEALAE